MKNVNKWITEYAACILLICGSIKKDELIICGAFFLLIQALIRTIENRNDEV